MTNKTEHEHLHHGACEDDECGCSEHGNSVIKLTMEDGSSKDFEVLHVLPYQEKHYVALSELGSGVYDILRFDELEEEVELNIIEDDAEYEAVAALFDDFFNSEDSDMPWEDEDIEEDEDAEK